MTNRSYYQSEKKSALLSDCLYTDKVLKILFLFLTEETIC